MRKKKKNIKHNRKAFHLSEEEGRGCVISAIIDSCAKFSFCTEGRKAS